MEAIEAIRTRRSIRRYTTQTVTEDMVKTLLDCAMCAPSANNLQPWHLVVINDRKIMGEIAGFHPYAKMLPDASLAILVCGDLSSPYWVQDCSAATQNILLAAHALGLGAVWLGIYPRSERVANIKRLIKIPDGISPLSLVAIGYPAETKKAHRGFRQDKIKYNIWS